MSNSTHHDPIADPLLDIIDEVQEFGSVDKCRRDAVEITPVDSSEDAATRELFIL